MDTLKKSLFKMDVDSLNGAIFKLLIIYAVPLLISNIYQQLYNTDDTMIVGNDLGDTSLAAIGSYTSTYD